MYTRREVLKLGGTAIAASVMLPEISWGRETGIVNHPGAVSGDPDGVRAGMKVLAEGGNAIDAVVAAALVTCVTANNKCGLAGYGGHMTIAFGGSNKVTCIDYNSAAPAAARADMFQINETGKVKDNLNSTGWLAAGVPGTLAGIQLALERYGTRSLSKLAAPAIELARNGFPVSASMARAIRGTAPALRRFPGSAGLFLKNGEPLKEGEIFRNPDLAKVLETLAESNSADAFYDGELARKIADAFQKNGGLVTTRDLAEYRAREVEPLSLKWGNLTIHTAPLTAGGLTIVQILNILQEMGWKKLRSEPERTHAFLEALRLSWRDRLALLGDPEQVEVPIKHLLSRDYAHELANQVRKTVKDKKPLSIHTPEVIDDGTMNLSAVDSAGNMVAMTLTQGGAFGSKVTIEGLGLVLGHGMWRFDPKPGHPNSVAPGKRPLHNMCPSIVTRKGKPVLAVGGAGGRTIPNSILGFLTNYVALEKSMDEAIAAPRLHNEGNMSVEIENSWPKAEVDYLALLGYKITVGPQAYVSAVSFNPKTGECRGVAR